jgi:hypothetical protein
MDNENMKKVFATLIILLLASLSLLSLVSANPSFPPDTPPIVSVSNMQANAEISNVNGQLWATVDIEYNTDTIRGLGDSYSVSLPKEYFPPNEPTHYVKIQVVSNKLEAHYPYPLNAKNLTVSVNNEMKEWQVDNKGLCHIFDSNLKEINWTIEPVPKAFSIRVHYEQPIAKTSANTQYLGEYALIFPLIPRYGSTDPPYPLYSWFSYRTTTSSFTIHTNNLVKQETAYSIDTQGSLTPINSTSKLSSIMQLQIQNNNEQKSFPYGLVVTINPANSYSNNYGFTTNSLDLTVIITVLIVACFVFLLLFRRHRKTAKA